MPEKFSLAVVVRTQVLLWILHGGRSEVPEGGGGLAARVTSCYTDLGHLHFFFPLLNTYAPIRGTASSDGGVVTGDVKAQKVKGRKEKKYLLNEPEGVTWASSLHRNGVHPIAEVVNKEC